MQIQKKGISGQCLPIYNLKYTYQNYRLRIMMALRFQKHP